MQKIRQPAWIRPCARSKPKMNPITNRAVSESANPQCRGLAKPLGSPESAVERWVRKFRVYQERRFGAKARPDAAQIEAFLEFMARRWQAAEWQQAEARAALEAWLVSHG